MYNWTPSRIATYVSEKTGPLLAETVGAGPTKSPIISKVANIEIMALRISYHSPFLLWCFIRRTVPLFPKSQLIHITSSLRGLPRQTLLTHTSTDLAPNLAD